jgi:hypothetical protein
VTEAEWLACTNPMAMLEHVGGRASGRKLRLFAVEVCLRCWQRLSDKPYGKAVEVAQRFTDGTVGPEELAAVYDEALRVAEQGCEGGALRPSLGRRLVHGPIRGCLGREQ